MNHAYMNSKSKNEGHGTLPPGLRMVEAMEEGTGADSWHAHSTPEPDIAPTPEREPIPPEVPVVDPQPNEVPQIDPVPIQDPIPHQAPVSA